VSGRESLRDAAPPDPAPKNSLYDFRLYWREDDGTWTIREVFHDRDEAIEFLLIDRIQFPAAELRLARRTTLEEWLDV